MQIVEIDPEFQALCPPLLPEELQQLEASLRIEGCREPLCVWWEQHERLYCKYCDAEVTTHFDDGRWICEVCQYGIAPDIYLLLDGHNRHAICSAEGIHFETTEIALDTREDAINWIINSQLGRRNLTEEQKSYLRGKRYNLEKRPPGRPKKPQKTSDISAPPMQRLATHYGVSADTIQKDGRFATAVDTLESQVRQDIRETILRRAAPSGEHITKDLATRTGKFVREETVKPQPFMQQKHWKPYHVLEAIDLLAELPKEEHAAINRLLEGPFIPADDGLKILTNLTTMPDEKRQHLYALQSNGVKRDADLALALAAAKAPPPDPQSQLADSLILALQQVQQRLRRNWINAHPHEPWSDALRDLEADLLQIMTRLTSIQAHVETAHKERLATYGTPG